ncbi:MAG: Rne/Rng family ribonuclease [Myxococcales bacterium]|jgi:ribonuclease G|nr:Rne/Rng family ribonuclease [Myxococcales bacterium]
MAQENIIVINVDLAETRVAIIENGMIVELLVERENHRSAVGNIYRGRVTRVLPGMQAAFVDIGRDKHAFLHASDLLHPDEHEAEFESPQGGDEGTTGDTAPKPRQKGGRQSAKTSIRDVIREGEFIAVQVSKDQIGTKGCRVTADVSLPGRHLVYMPFSDRGGISRKIDSAKERARLSSILGQIAPEKGALIARTAAQQISQEALAADANYLVETWSDAKKAYTKHKKPTLLYEELSVILRVVRDYFNDSIAEIFIDDAREAARLRSFLQRLVPGRSDVVRLYEGDEPIYDAFGIEVEIRRALERVVELPSGGSLVIDQGEALTAVDVNTGRFVGAGARDQEETILATNLEAVAEIAYQMRFRNIGGLIVLDLIDMDRPTSRKKVMDRLMEVLRNDRAKTSVNSISRFSLVEMTRERTRESLGRTLHERCLYCDGTGHTLSRLTVANEIMREVQRRYDEVDGVEFEVKLHPGVIEVFKGELAPSLKRLEKQVGKKIILQGDPTRHLESFVVQVRSAKQKIMRESNQP